MKIIYIPSKVTSHINGYELLLRLHNDLSNCKNEEIQISFKNVFWFEANLVAILGAIIEDLEDRNNIIVIIDVENFKNKNDILFRNGFLPHYGIFSDSLFSSSTQIPYKKFREGEPHLYNSYIQTELLDNKDFPSHTERLGNEIKRNIYELFENARTHGKCKNIHTCGQFYPTRKKLHITIVDTGKTIVNNVRDFLKIEMNSSECIAWAMATGNTTKNGNTPGGLGLGLIFDFINLNKGKIQIVSSNGYWELREGIISKTDLNFSFDGTIANLEFDLTEDKHYRLKNEVSELDNIF
ncbi:hypothetical protein AAIP31_002290 [Flavobacterium psychrophilum]|nr:hypothetical protein [Flavobacterium psychrophilum]